MEGEQRGREEEKKEDFLVFFQGAREKPKDRRKSFRRWQPRKRAYFASQEQSAAGEKKYLCEKSHLNEQEGVRMQKP